MSETVEILCSRCGTPFPKDRGKAGGVTCVVCGQLRPDLDLTLDDDDAAAASALGSGSGIASAATATVASTEGSRVASSPPVAPPMMHTVVAPMDTGSAAPFRVDRPYVAMSEPPLRDMYLPSSEDGLSDRIGPVLMVIAPLTAGMLGALNMLGRVPDFSVGSWYAVGAVFLVLLIAALFAGLASAGLLYLVRLRWKIVLRLVFAAAAAAVCYAGVSEVPSRVQVRENDLPGFMVRQ